MRVSLRFVFILYVYKKTGICMHSPKYMHAHAERIRLFSKQTIHTVQYKSVYGFATAQACPRNDDNSDFFLPNFYAKQIQ